MVLENGVRVVIVPQMRARSVSIMALVKAGSEYERKKEMGISHFLEHLRFEGSKNFPKGEIIEEIERAGGSINATTQKELAAYYVKLPYYAVDKGLEVLSEMMVWPLLRERDVENIKPVVKEEIAMISDVPSIKIGEILDALLYDNQPAGWPTLGTKESVYSFNSQMAKDFINRRCSGNSLLIAAGGHVPPDIEEKIRIYFSDASGFKEDIPLKIKEGQTRAQAVLVKKDIHQTNLLLGFRGYNAQYPERYAQRLLSVLLGEGMSSRLFNSIRKESGLAYNIETSVEVFSHRGVFTIYVGVDPANAKETIEKILKECTKVVGEGINKEELQKGKNQLRGNLFVASDDPQFLASFHGTSELLRGEILTPEEILKEYDKVTKDQIQKVAEKLFRPSNTNLALIGPHSPEKKEGLREMLEKGLTLTT